MMPGIDPQKLAQAQEMGQHIKAVIRTDYKDYTVQLSFSTDMSGMGQFMEQFLEQFSGTLASQLSSFFAIKGELIEVGKEPSAEG